MFGHPFALPSSAGRYFPLKYLFGTCLNNFVINHSHTVLLLHICQCEAERWGDLKIYIFGDVVLSVIGLGGAKNGSKKGGVASRRKKRAIFSLHFGSSQALYIARICFKTFSLESSIPLLQDALVWS